MKYTTLVMAENAPNKPYPDMSEVFGTYKTHPDESKKSSPSDQIVPSLESSKITNNTQEGEIYMPKCTTFFEKNMFFLQIVSRQMLRVLQIMMDSFVKITKIALWSIAVLGGLFVAALATNTMDRAVNIINASVLSKWGKHITVSPENSSEYEVVVGTEQQPPVTNTGLTSSALGDSTSATPEVIAAKRRAVLEARKTAKIQEEKQKALEQFIQ